MLLSRLPAPSPPRVRQQERVFERLIGLLTTVPPPTRTCVSVGFTESLTAQVVTYNPRSMVFSNILSVFSFSSAGEIQGISRVDVVSTQLYAGQEDYGRAVLEILLILCWCARGRQRQISGTRNTGGWG